MVGDVSSSIVAREIVVALDVVALVDEQEEGRGGSDEQGSF